MLETVPHGSEPASAPADDPTTEAIDWATSFLAAVLGRLEHPPILRPELLTVLRGVAAGRANRAIAAEQFQAEDTIKSRMKVIFQLLEVRGRTLTILQSLRLGLVQPTDVLPSSHRVPKPSLSPTQAVILLLTACDLSKEDVARRIGLSRHTVHGHLRTVRTKLGVASNTHAVAVAALLGLITVPGITVQLPLCSADLGESEAHAESGQPA